MGIRLTSLGYAQYQAKRAAEIASKNAAVTVLEPSPYKGEAQLRNRILEHCYGQRPRWKVIWARDDKKSTLPAGANDLTIFMSNGRLLLMELKYGQGKLSADQRDWKYELGMLGHEVFVIKSFQEFLTLITQINQK
jgi:hypothetical protein